MGRVDRWRSAAAEGERVKVSWDQAFAWRLRRQFMEPARDAKVDAVGIVGRLCGVQAQVASSAALAVALRQNREKREAADDLERALAEGALVKTWAMRGTLHLLTPAAASAFLSLMASARTWEKPVWQRSFMERLRRRWPGLVDRVSALLDGTVLTREESVSAIVADKRFAGMEEQLRSGWGALLKPLAWQGALCHAPGWGNKAAFTRPDSLASDWPGVPDPDEAAVEAYLGAYGPATPETFDAWLTRGYLRKTTLRKWFEDMGDRLTQVDVEGGAAYILTEHADELGRTKPSKSVHLLGASTSTYWDRAPRTPNCCRRSTVRR